MRFVRFILLKERDYRIMGNWTNAFECKNDFQLVVAKYVFFSLSLSRIYVLFCSRRRRQRRCLMNFFSAPILARFCGSGFTFLRNIALCYSLSLSLDIGRCSLFLFTLHTVVAFFLFSHRMFLFLFCSPQLSLSFRKAKKRVQYILFWLLHFEFYIILVCTLTYTVRIYSERIFNSFRSRTRIWNKSEKYTPRMRGAGGKNSARWRHKENKNKL